MKKKKSYNQNQDYHDDKKWVHDLHDKINEESYKKPFYKNKNKNKNYINYFPNNENIKNEKVITPYTPPPETVEIKLSIGDQEIDIFINEESFFQDNFQILKDDKINLKEIDFCALKICILKEIIDGNHFLAKKNRFLQLYEECLSKYAEIRRVKEL